MENSEKAISSKELAELRELKRKDHRRNAFMLLIALQAGTVLLSYYLGKSHK